MEAKVDISKIGLTVDKPCEEDEVRIAQEIKEALIKFGYVYLYGHGIDEHLVDALFKDSKSFFDDLTEEEKLKSWPKDPVTAQGYKIGKTPLESGLVEVKETMNIIGLKSEDSFPDSTHSKIRGEIAELGDKFKSLSHRILRLLALALNKPADYFDQHHTKFFEYPDNQSRIRVIHYPKMDGELIPGMTTCGEHSYWGAMTLKFQDDLGWLQLKCKQKGWVTAKDIPGCVLLNIADLMELWSGGLFCATEHRVVIPDDKEKMDKSRHSVVFFVHPDENVHVEPLISTEKKLQGKTAGDHVKEMKLKKTCNMRKND